MYVHTDIIWVHYYTTKNIIDVSTRIIKLLIIILKLHTFINVDICMCAVSTHISFTTFLQYCGYSLYSCWGVIHVILWDITSRIDYLGSFGSG